MKRLLITGSPRSGTTAITELLCHDSNMFVTNEMQTYLFNPESHRQIADWKRRLDTLESGNIVSYNWFLKKGATVGQVKSLPPGERCLDFQHSLGYDIVGDKLPHYINKLDIVNKRFCELYYIFTVRDPRAVIASSLRHHKKSMDEGKAPAHWQFKSPEEACEMWVEFNSSLKHCLEQIHPSRYVLLRYEDCVQNAVRPLMMISALLDYDIEVPNPKGSYYPVHLETWKDEIPDVNDHLSEECLKLMEDFGYSGV